MYSKMTTTSQPKKKKNRTGTESQKWRSHGVLPVGRGRGKMEEKVHGIRTIIGRYKIDRGRLRIV